MQEHRPFIVGLGGTSRPGSATERLVRRALDECEALGADTRMFGGNDLDLPMYAPGVTDRTEKAAALIEGLRRADGIVLSSPGYHGTVSGLVKNALDYAEDLAQDSLAYFEGRAVGLIAVAAGWQATGTTLATLRAIVHSLRGWPTPMAVAINSAPGVFDAEGHVIDENTARQLRVLAEQVVGFARMRALHELATRAHDAETSAERR